VEVPASRLLRQRRVGGLSLAVGLVLSVAIEKVMLMAAAVAGNDSTVTISGIVGTGKPQWVSFYYINNDDMGCEHPFLSTHTPILMLYTLSRG
jgi:hypothetical protein